MIDRTTRGLVVAVSVTAPLVIASSGAISYSSLYQLALVVGGYSQLEAHLFPFPIDFTLGGAVAASFLLARWRAPLVPRFWVALQVALSALVTISGNALHATIVGDAHNWPWGLRLAVSAVPGAAIVGMTHTVTIMLRSRPAVVSTEGARGSEVGARHETPRPGRPQLTAAPIEARVRALLQRGGVPGLSGRERADLISRIADAAHASKSYVRKIAVRLEREDLIKPGEEVA